MKRLIIIFLLIIYFCLCSISAYSLPEGAFARLGIGEINDLVFSPDGSILAVATDFALHIYDASNWSQLAYYENGMSMNSIDFSRDGSILAIGSSDATIRLWDVRKNHVVNALIAHKGRVNSVSFSPDGKFLASSEDKDNSIFLWDIQKRQLIAKLTGHSKYVFSVSFSSDGKFLVSSGADNVALIWDVEKRQVVDKLNEGWS